MLAPRRHAPIATIAIEYKLMLGRDLDASVGKGFMEDCTPRQPVSIRGRVSSFKYSVKYSRNAMYTRNAMQTAGALAIPNCGRPDDLTRR